jgi:hypothetical protein
MSLFYRLCAAAGQAYHFDPWIALRQLLQHLAGEQRVIHNQQAYAHTSGMVAAVEVRAATQGRTLWCIGRLS